ncbi:MAG: prepilin-type N-terminal cleavage/methylation domain-containing protein [Vulcanimicrobiota bacterium]
MKKRKKGFTIVELLIAGGLGLLILGLMYSFFTRTTRITARGTLRTDMQQAAMRVMSSISKDLELSATSGVSVVGSGSSEPPVIMGIVPILNVLDDGTQQWDNRLTVYSWTSKGGQVTKKIWKNGDPPALTVELSLNGLMPLRVSETVLSSIADEPKLQAQILANGVKSLEITHNGVGSAVESPVKVTIELERSGNTGATGTEKYKLTSKFTVRNQ